MSLLSLPRFPSLVFPRPNKRLGLVLTMSVNLLSAVLTGAAGIFIAHLVGPAGRGIYAAAITWGSALGTLLLFGVNEAIVYVAAKQLISPARLLAAILALSSSQAVVIFMVAALVPAVGAFSSEIQAALRAYLFYLPSYLSLLYLTCFCLGSDRVLLFNTCKFMNAAPPLLSVCWAFSKDHSVNAVFRAMPVFGYLAVTVCCTVLAMRGFRLAGGRVINDLHVLLKYGLRAYWSTLFSFANLRLDQLILSTSVALATLGAYSIAASYSMLFYPFSAAIANLLFPTIASSAPENRSMHLRRSVGAVILVMTGGMAFLLCVRRWLLPFLYGPMYRDIGPVVTVLCLAAWCFGINYVMSDALRGLNRPGLVSAAEAVSAVITCAGLYVALPRFGVLGAAWVSLFSYFTVTAILYFSLRKSIQSGIVRAGHPAT